MSNQRSLQESNEEGFEELEPLRQGKKIPPFDRSAEDDPADADPDFDFDDDLTGPSFDDRAMQSSFASPNVIDLQETETEFLLFVPYGERERAKGIDGRRWDPERRCWVYPRTARTFDTLVAEFGDDLITLSITRPAPAERASRPSPDVATSLQRQLADFRAALEQVTKARDVHKAEIFALEEAFIASQREVEALRKALSDAHRLLEEARARTADVQAEIGALKADRRANDTSTVEKVIRDAAIDATGKGAVFVDLLAKLKLDSRLPLEIVKHMERAFRKLLSNDEPRVTLHELIQLARQQELLAPELIDLAHTIRRQRNVLAHDQVDERTIQGRVYLSLFAAALLWPYLPEVE